MTTRRFSQARALATAAVLLAAALAVLPTGGCAHAEASRFRRHRAAVVEPSSPRAEALLGAMREQSGRPADRAPVRP